MSLRIRALRLAVMTSAGLYGRELHFEDGLNVLLVDNASGKSTCVQAMIYALGLEAMLSAKHDVPLPHSMVEYLEGEQGRKLNVVESEVWLVVQNASGETLTLRRPVKNSLDHRLITIWERDVLAEPQDAGPGTDFYVRQAGAASSARGFHRRLTEFLGWRLPEVVRFDGTECPLYLECIFPLLFIEQKRGWSGIQAAMPLQFSIRDARKRAIEFLLDLDATRIAIEREELRQAFADVRNEWAGIGDRLRSLAEEVGGEVHSLPASPVALWPPKVLPQVFLEQDSELRGLRSAVRAIRERLQALEQQEIPRIAEDAERLSALLDVRMGELAELNVALSEIQEDARAELAEKAAIGQRLLELERDLDEYLDLRKLQRMGSKEAAQLELSVCPTCEQKIEDSLLSQKDGYSPLSIQENIDFLKAQQATFKAMLDVSEREIERKVRRNRRVISHINERRQEIRSIRTSLVAEGHAPSEAAIEERIRLRDYLRKVERTEETIGVYLLQLEELANRQRELLDREAEMPKGTLSDRDQVKLAAVKRSLIEQLNEYGLRSLNAAGFAIDPGTYHPTYEEFDLGFDLAASDMIRLIWAYVTALLEVARTAETNHPGLLVLDEPQQQNVKDLSLTAFVDRASASKQHNQQVILAVSRLPDEFDARATVDFALTRIDGWVLQPLSP